MNVVVVSGVFPPEPVVSSSTSFDVACELTERGHNVTVVAPFPNRPGGRIYAGYQRALFRREAAAEGFRIIRCASFFSRRSSMISRVAENISFGLMSSLVLLTRRAPDVVYANTWPILAAAMLSVVARLRRVPVVVSVQDIYPESLLSQRRKGSGAMARILTAIDRRIARGAAAVVVISERFAEHYSRTRRVDPSRLHVVPNWLSASETEEKPGSADACRARHGIPPDAFLLVYGGNVGVAAAVETVIEAVADAGDIHLLIAGEGASLENCRRRAARIAPDRIHFESPWTDTTGVLYAADAFVLPTHGAQSSASVPSKLISYLLAARPIVAAALESSDVAGIVRKSGAGGVVAPDDKAAFADAVRKVSLLSPDKRRRMGSAGRVWALANVVREVCLPHLVSIIEAASRKRCGERVIHHPEQAP